MKTITIQAQTDKYTEVALAGGEELKFTAAGGGLRTAQLQTADAEVTLLARRQSELCAPKWKLHALLFWILGFFGFFTSRYRKTDCYFLNYAVTLSVHDGGKALVKIRRPDNGCERRKAVSLRTDMRVVEERDDGYTKDVTAEKRRKRYLLCSWAARAVCAVILGVIIFLLIK